MIRVFGKTDKTFDSNGDAILHPFRAKVHNNDNGDFYLDLEIGLEHVDNLVEGNIIIANTPQGDQAFRISNVVKTKNKISTKAWHVFYDSENYLIPDSYVVEKDCNDALNHLNDATEPLSEFTVSSDVSHVDSFRCVRKSLYEAIQEVLKRWGGHLVRNNFDIQIKESIGQDHGIVVQYKKNLREITCSEDWSRVVTKILPVGKDGTLLNALDPTASIYITSSTQYEIPYTKTVSFSQDIKKEEYETEEAYKQALVLNLRSQATEYLAENCVPKVNYTLKANLEKVTDLGDEIEVRDERLGIDLMTSVIGYEYDCLLDKYSEVEFGNFTNSLSGLMETITNTTTEIVKETSQESQDQIIDILTNSYVIYEGDKILVVNSLPKETATHVITIDQSGIGFSNGVGALQTSKWNIDGSLKLNTKTINDFVIEQGTSSGWNYRKYASGLIELWGVINVSGITWNAGVTNQFVATKQLDIPIHVTNSVVSVTAENNIQGIRVVSAGHDPSNDKLTLNFEQFNTSAIGTAVDVNVFIRGKES